MNKIWSQLVIYGFVLSLGGPSFAMIDEPQGIRTVRSQSYKYEDGCEIEKIAQDYRVKKGEESFQFDRKDKIVFNYETGEVVIEFTGQATDKNGTRSWAEADFGPNSHSPLHYHSKGTEDYYIVEGNKDAVATVDGISHILMTGTYLRILPNQYHQVVNGSQTEKLTLLVKCTPAWTSEDHILIKKDH